MCPFSFFGVKMCNLGSLCYEKIQKRKANKGSRKVMTNKIDIEKIIRLVLEQAPDREDIVTALQNCKVGHWSTNGYYQFVNSRNPNKPGSEWQHEECVIIEQENEGDIVIDLLKDGQIGGIEFLDLIDK